MRAPFLLAQFIVFLLLGCTDPANSEISLSSDSSLTTHSDRHFMNEQQPDVNLLDDACALLASRPHWRSTLREAKIKWQLQPWFILAFIHQESRFNPTAISTSKAYGYPQAKDDTWHWYQEKSGHYDAKRTRFDDSVDFMGFYVSQNSIRNGTATNDVKNQYLAYHEGMGGFERSTYLGKPWLLNVSEKVADRAALYQAQLINCPVQ